MLASPSARKVDDFLSSLSQLSQDRLHEDQQRQREYQRNIDELRLRLASPKKTTIKPPTRPIKPETIRLSKAQFLSDLAELDAPPLPQRPENQPPLPKRPGDLPPPPELPRRRQNGFLGEYGDDTGVCIKPEINLMRPVARELNTSFNSSVSGTTNTDFRGKMALRDDFSELGISRASEFDSGWKKNEKKHSSFADLERDIRSGKRPETQVKSILEREFAVDGDKFSGNEQKLRFEQNLRNEQSLRNEQNPRNEPNLRNERSIRNEQGLLQETGNEQNIERNRSSGNQGTRLENNQDFKNREAWRNIQTPQTTPLSRKNDLSADDQKSPPKKSISSVPSAAHETKTFAPMKPAKSKHLSSLQTSNLPMPSYFNALSAMQAAKAPPLAQTSLNPPTSKPSKTITPKAASPPRKPAKPTLWLDSVVGKDNGHSEYVEEPKRNLQATPSGNKLWLDSAVDRDSTPNTYIDPSKRTFSINKGLSSSPEKNSWLNSAVSKKTDTHLYVDQGPKYVISKPKSTSPRLPEATEEKKPDYLSHLAKFRKETERVAPPKPDKLKKDEKTEELEFLMQKDKILKSRIPPPKPSKPSNSYESGDTELLKSQLGRLSPTKAAKSAASLLKYENQDNELLKSQLSKFLKAAPSKPAKKVAAYEEKDSELLKTQLKRLERAKETARPEEAPAEGIAALGRLRPAKAAPQKPAEKPEALRKLDALKPKKEEPKKTPANFQDELASLLRVNTVPVKGQQQLKAPERAHTEPIPKMDAKSDKLTHPNKARAKGPKRRLPTKHAEKAEPKTETIADYKRKVPPPKALKPPNIQGRSFSGEVFI